MTPEKLDERTLWAWNMAQMPNGIVKLKQIIKMCVEDEREMCAKEVTEHAKELDEPGGENVGRDILLFAAHRLRNGKKAGKKK